MEKGDILFFKEDDVIIGGVLQRTFAYHGELVCTIRAVLNRKVLDFNIIDLDDEILTVDEFKELIESISHTDKLPRGQRSTIPDEFLPAEVKCSFTLNDDSYEVLIKTNNNEFTYKRALSKD